ncbi:hypothetical protein HZB93_00825 [Candidatus Falkowbacteria bacterium]|nr:hypothetical protein [Candidatus Falkowbacteria bacterium]
MFSEVMFWIGIVCFPVFLVVRWMEALKAERFPVGKIVAVTLAFVLCLAAALLYKFCFVSHGLSGPFKQLGAILVIIALGVTAVIGFVKTAPAIPCTPPRERRSG